jgi:hypothetical protein
VPAGCDPSEPPPVTANGPAFLVVGVTPVAADAGPTGTTLFVQARGGDFVAVNSVGCTHSLGPYSGVTSSCDQVSYYGSQPTFVTADPEGTPCTVDVFLYSICGCFDAGIQYDYTSGPSAFGWCDSVGTLVSEQQVTLGPPAPDASADAPPTADGGAADSNDTGDP